MKAFSNPQAVRGVTSPGPTSYTPLVNIAIWPVKKNLSRDYTRGALGVETKTSPGSLSKAAIFSESESARNPGVYGARCRVSWAALLKISAPAPDAAS